MEHKGESAFGRVLTECRLCKGKNLYEFIDLGLMPPADGIHSPEEIEHPETLFPLKVCQCEDCGLTQLRYAVNPRLLYNQKYRYETSMTETGKKHFLSMADSISRAFPFAKDSLAIDIGSNVGVLLEGFKNNGFRVLGIDPSPRIVNIANSRGIETWEAFMNTQVAEKILTTIGKAKLITGTNVFAHIDDKAGLIDSVKMLLDDDGAFIIEVPYLVDLIEKLEYDTIYLDHLEYMSVKPLISFFRQHGMDVFDVEKYAIHGTSIRVFVSRKGKRPISKNVEKFLALEEATGIYKKETLDKFARDVDSHRREFIDMLRDLKKQGKTIAGISAPAKGNTLLNYCKLHTDVIDYMTEKSQIKQGNYTPGMRIPIHGDDKLLSDKPDYGIIFAWNFAEEIMKNNQQFLEHGGKFIVPIPKPTVVGKEELAEILKNLELKDMYEITKIDPVFTDERGSITDLLNEKNSHVGLITTEAGAVRANHYHKESTQYSYVLSGSFEVLLAPASNPKNVKKVIVGAGELITIKPNIIHAFKAREKTVMVDIISESRAGNNYEEDTIRVRLEDPDGVKNPIFDKGSEFNREAQLSQNLRDSLQGNVRENRPQQAHQEPQRMWEQGL